MACQASAEMSGVVRHPHHPERYVCVSIHFHLTSWAYGFNIVCMGEYAAVDGMSKRHLEYELHYLAQDKCSVPFLQQRRRLHSHSPG